MSMRTVELVSEWDTVPFDGGYDGLRSLSDQGFSGAVTAGPTQLFMLNGTVVGVLDGDIEAFDGADGTARAAPHDALPLLVVMQDRADGPRAQYYTEDTPVSDVDRTLKDGNFTGFVELSENVLSGDYYLVYHQGRSMSVAWVGTAQRLVTDEEAFEQADGEVGIYQVMPADIEPVEIPEPPEPGPSAEEGAGAAVPDDGSDGRARDEDDAGSPEGVTADEGRESETEAESAPTDGSAVAASDRAESDDASETGTATAATADVSERGTGPAGPPGSKAAGASQGTAVDRHRQGQSEPGATDSGAADETTAAEAETAATEPADPALGETKPDASTASDAEPELSRSDEPEAAAAAEPASAPTEASERETARETKTAETPTERTEEPATTENAGESRTAADSDAVGDLETRSIPSLDPDRSSSTAEPTATSTASQQSAQKKSSQQSAQKKSSQQSTQKKPSQQSASAKSSQQQTRSADSSAARRAPATESDRSEESATAAEPEPSPELRAELADREAEIAELESEIRDLSAENDELTAERDRLLGDLEEARAEIQRLEEELAAAGGPAPSGRSLSAAEAIDGTNLFVRYHSKGEATLEKAKNGSADRSSVEDNLRLEHHTQFDGANAAVDGEPFEEFLHDSIQYRFVDWLVRNLLYEIRDTGHESAMGVLYDALPAVDRAELNGKVSVTYTEDGQEHRSQETFDVVVRDRMGNPLVVANINDSRQPATDGQMTDIVRNAERVGNASDSLAGAFLVTSSFFEPEALETAEEATSSGLFSRDKRKSFVNLSRKGGYHLCLLEARNREFHLAVPEL
ncbi:DUF7527 domain-containing protein [Haloarcula onubensis]|uniref:DUF7527 domain-containing protein n=1 Tax=Haloarcula onubensis TaxID=2950539 RepID=A0ABU2FQB1_9EURY|nr:hypothetical protein [Halomicroarcula sp. S3CR25-11]MDS0282942.1 hypothetical protein [Halomicroarcula sp. S3CR25-11]